MPFLTIYTHICVMWWFIPNDNNSLFVAYDILLEFVYVKIVFFFLFFNQICIRFFPHMINRFIIFLLKIFLEKDSFRIKINHAAVATLVWHCK